MTDRILSRLTYETFLGAVLRRPKTVHFAVLAVSLFFAAQIPGLRFSTSIYDLIIQDLPETERYGQFKEIFGSDEIIQVVIKAENIFDPPTYAYI